MCEVRSHISKQITHQTGWLLIQHLNLIFLCVSNLTVHIVANEVAPQELDLPWLWGQSSRWKMTIRGLFLKHKAASLTFQHQRQWTLIFFSNSHNCFLPWPGPVESLLISLSPDQLISPTWTDMDTIRSKHFLHYTHSFSFRGTDDVHRPLDRVWGILLPDFGMYFPKADDTHTRIKSTDDAALIIFIGFLGDDKHTQREIQITKPNLFQMFRLHDQSKNMKWNQLGVEETQAVSAPQGGKPTLWFQEDFAGSQSLALWLPEHPRLLYLDQILGYVSCLQQKLLRFKQ